MPDINRNEVNNLNCKTEDRIYKTEENRRMECAHPYGQCWVR